MSDQIHSQWIPFSFHRVSPPTRLTLLILLALAVAVRVFFVYQTPAFMHDLPGPIQPFNDERFHLKYSLYLKTHHSFPINHHIKDPDDPAGQEKEWIFTDAQFAQPPLFYVLNTPFTFFSNPLLASRLFSVFLNCLLVLFVVSCSIQVFSDKDLAAVTTMTLVGFAPVMVRLGSTVTNDNLVWLLSAIAFDLYLKGGLLKRPLLAGLLMALGILTRVSFLLWPLFLVVDLVLRRELRAHFAKLVILLCVTFLLCGGWFIRNQRIYGDWTGIIGTSGRPGGYLRSGNLDVLQGFAEAGMRFAAFPIAEETPKYMPAVRALFLFSLIGFGLQFHEIKTYFEKETTFFSFLLFTAINAGLFVYANLWRDFAESRHLYIGLVPLAAITAAIFMRNFGRGSVVFALVIPVVYFVALW